MQLLSTSKGPACPISSLGVKKGEKTIAESAVIPQIVDRARHAIEQLAQFYPDKIVIVEGKFQADSYIQHLLTEKIVDLAIGNDADFSVIAGEACLQLSCFDISVKRTKKARPRRPDCGHKCDTANWL